MNCPILPHLLFAVSLLAGLFGSAVRATASQEDPPHIVGLDSRDSEVRRATIRFLGSTCDASAVGSLISAFGDGRNRILEADIAETLGKIGDVAVDPLIAALDDHNPRVRRGAALALGKIGGDRAFAALISALNDKEGYVRAGAVDALGSTGDHHAVTHLISSLQDSDDSVRYRAAVALGRVGDTRAIRPLIAALRDSQKMVREYAAEALGTIGDPQAVVPLTAALRDDHPDVRGRAARALGAIGDSRAVPALIAALDTKDDSARMQITFALEKLSEAKTVGAWIASLGSSSAGWQARLALEKIGEPAIDPLKEALNDSDPVVRGRAALVLAEISDTRPIESIIESLSDSDINFRRAAAARLSQIGDVRAVMPLVSLLRREIQQSWADECRYVVDALGELGDPRAVEALRPLLGRVHLSYATAVSLKKLKWKPETIEDRIYMMAAVRDPDLRIARNWPSARDVLLRDARSGERDKVENAVKTLIWIGNETVLPDLLEIIQNRGSPVIAQALLNSNRADLRSAAIDWATANGFRIESFSRSVSTWNWGSK